MQRIGRRSGRSWSDRHRSGVRARRDRAASPRLAARQADRRAVRPPLPIERGVGRGGRRVGAGAVHAVGPADVQRLERLLPRGDGGLRARPEVAVDLADVVRPERQDVLQLADRRRRDRPAGASAAAGRPSARPAASGAAPAPAAPPSTSATDAGGAATTGAPRSAATPPTTRPCRCRDAAGASRGRHRAGCSARCDTPRSRGSPGCRAARGCRWRTSSPRRPRPARDRGWRSASPTPARPAWTDNELPPRTLRTVNVPRSTPPRQRPRTYDFHCSMPAVGPAAGTVPAPS